MKVLVQFIQDRSGSMLDIWGETLNGFKVYVEDLKNAGQRDGVEYYMTLTAFDTAIDTPFVQKGIWELMGDELKAYPPRYGTALYDAVGSTLAKTDSTGFDKVICIVVTDGQENSSREWKKDTLQKAIDDKVALGNWTFTYLGTQPSTWSDASALGHNVLSNSAVFSCAKTGDTYKVMASRTVSLSNSSKSSSDNFYTDSAYVTSADIAEANKAELKVQQTTTEEKESK